MRSLGYFLLVLGIVCFILGFNFLPDSGPITWESFRLGFSGVLSAPKLAMIWGAILIFAGLVFVL